MRRCPLCTRPPPARIRRSLASALLAVVVATAVVTFGATPAGAATAPMLWSDTMLVEFAPTTIGSTSPAEIVTFTNAGPSALGLALDLEGSSAFWIEWATCGQALDPGRSCIVAVGFRPHPTGMVANGAVVLSAAGGSRRRVALVGRPEAPASPLRVTPTGLDFGPIPVETVSDSRSIVITNTSSLVAPLSMTLPAVTSEAFMASGNSCGAFLAPFASCALSYRFRARTTGPIEARSRLTVTTTGGNPRPYPVTLRGHGGLAGAPLVTVSPIGLDFGRVAVGARSAPQTITVTNTSTTPQTPRVVGFDAVFEVGPGCGGSTVAPGATCRFALTAAPVELGLDARPYEVEVGLGGGRVHRVPVDLSVTATNAPRLRVNRSSVDLGPAPLGPTPRVKTVVITNTGTAPAEGLTVTPTAGSPLLTVSGSTCGTTLAAGASCTLTVRYTPVSYGRVHRVFHIVAGSLGHRLDLWGGLRPGVEEAWVVHLLSAYFDRDPVGDEAKDLAAAIEAESTTRLAVATGIVTGEEYIGGLVRRFYQDTLGRPGDAAGMRFWVTEIRERRRTVAQVVASFYSSPEYFAGIGGGTTRTWVADVYRKLLGRPADAAGLDYWVGQVAAQGRTRVALRFYETPESRGTRVGNVLDPLGRVATAAELAAWSTRIGHLGDLALGAEVASLDEVVRRAQDGNR